MCMCVTPQILSLNGATHGVVRLHHSGGSLLPAWILAHNTQAAAAGQSLAYQDVKLIISLNDTPFCSPMCASGRTAPHLPTRPSTVTLFIASKAQIRIQ